MSKIRFTGLLALCAVLAACSDSPTSSIAPPKTLPSFDVLTDVDPFSLRTVDLSALGEVGILEAATGGRASGHADALTFGGNFRDKYSFIALSTAPTPTAAFAAKGQFEGGFVNTSGTTSVQVHADVDCLSIVGNQAWVSGPVEKLIINGQQVPTTSHVIVRVQDRGEGAKEPPDLISPIFFSGPQVCRLRPNVAMVVNENGNIQVQQK